MPAAVLQTLALLSLTNAASGVTESAPVTVSSSANLVQLTATLGAADLINPLAVFTLEIWRLDDDQVWRLDHGFTFQGAAGLVNQPFMQTDIGSRDGNGNLVGPNLANRSVKARLTNNGALLASLAVGLTVT